MPAVSLSLCINLQLGCMRRCYRVKEDLANYYFLVFRLLLETKGLDYILNGNIQSDPLEKRFEGIIKLVVLTILVVRNKLWM